MQTDGLIVCDTAPALTLADEELRIETPGNNGVDHRVIGAVEVVLLRNSEKLAISIRRPRPVVEYEYASKITG